MQAFIDGGDLNQCASLVTYSFSGDLGHVTSITNPQVEEGDRRFLANEILQEVWWVVGKWGEICCSEIISLAHSLPYLIFLVSGLAGKSVNLILYLQQYRPGFCHVNV